MLILAGVVVVAAVFALGFVGRGSGRPGGVALGRRTVAVGGGVAAAAVLAAVLSGAGSSTGSSRAVLGVVLIASLAAVALTRTRRGRAVAERSWSAPASATTGVAGSGGTHWPGPAKVARALARVEAREFSASPWFGLGVGFCVIVYVLFGVVWARDNNQTWVEFIQLTPWFALPLVGMSVLAGHRAVTRAVRDGTDELMDTCPTDPATRTAALLLTAMVPVAALVVFFTILGITVKIRSPRLHGPVGLDSIADVAAALALGAGGVALGVALGRWVRFSLAPVVAVVAIGFATLAINGAGGHGWNPVAALSTAPPVKGPSPVFADRPTLWHLVWLIGLTAGAAVVALARHRRDRIVTMVAAAAAVAVAAAAIGATRPLSTGSARHIAELVARPEAHEECVGIGGPVATGGRTGSPLEACVFPFHHELLGRLARRVEPIGRVLPAGLARVTLRQRFTGKLGDLPPEVRRQLTAKDLTRPPGEVELGFGKGLSNIVVDVGFDVAFASVGLPVRPDSQRLPAVVSGQSRGVVALWLATRGLDPGRAARASTSAEPASNDSFARGSVEPVDDPCIAPAVVWSAQDLAAARALLTLPADEVARVVTAGWDRWSNPATGTDELLRALGLPAVGPFDLVIARPGHSC